jgi:hypothetical protein
VSTCAACHARTHACTQAQRALLHDRLQLRCASVNNKNLARCFDALGLASLLSEDNQPAMFKNKADVVEAIIGGTSSRAWWLSTTQRQLLTLTLCVALSLLELAEVCARQSHSDSNVTQAKSVLDELLAYISYSVSLSLLNVRRVTVWPCSSPSNPPWLRR